MISVLIPTYNYDVCALVQSVHKQCVTTDVAFEICILDDCSSDAFSASKNETLATLHHVTFLKNKLNLGRTATRNKLAENAKFEWLLFLDADTLPKTDAFISTYIEQLAANYDCIFGGISYSKDIPKQEELLRWTYGNLREVKTVDQREKHPFDIISQNLCIKKAMFLRCNPEHYNAYGMDILFSYNLKKNNANMLHIENPIVHFGLENTTVFLEKTLKAVKSTYKMEQEGIIANDARPLQRVYLKLKKGGGITLFQTTYQLIALRALKNLASNKPSMRLLDAYKLNHYIHLKNNG